MDGGIRILLADEQSLFREAVRVVLEAEPGMEVVAEARDGVQAVLEAEKSHPHVAFVDSNLPNRDVIQTTRAIRSHVPECRVVVVGSEGDNEILIDAVKAGACGFLTRESPLLELIDAARTVHRGETLIPGHMLGTLLDALIRQRRGEDEALKRAARLTRREKEVLALLAEGANNDVIAQCLVISPQTARTHIQNVLGKLGVHSRLEAAAFVVQNGILGDLVAAGG
jgi:NarL family two-component system response regulator LiaR